MKSNRKLQQLMTVLASLESPFAKRVGRVILGGRDRSKRVNEVARYFIRTAKQVPRLRK